MIRSSLMGDLLTGSVHDDVLQAPIYPPNTLETLKSHAIHADVTLYRCYSLSSCVLFPTHRSLLSFSFACSGALHKPCDATSKG